MIRSMPEPASQGLAAMTVLEASIDAVTKIAEANAARTGFPVIARPVTT